MFLIMSVMIHEPAVLIEGVLFRARYLGSTQLVCEGQPTKTTRMTQAEEAVSRIKVRFLCFICASFCFCF
ncbi:Protein lin-10 [Periplaneta americana]|uniref:Protein lin-10 n=1 Tax=Periplaneta americana TaxID=6978 RepID=A0ABQ8SKI8_PERAM|nr:Protein lin-10 [Periplaneta americana]